MKKIISMALSICISTSLFVQVHSAAADNYGIEIGEYLQMGTYYEKPILWRCVDIDENGPLMLSDKIICLKPFDTGGMNIDASHGRGNYRFGRWRQSYGSNYWGDSNIRCWLNSDDEAGNVTWICGNSPVDDQTLTGSNGYADESGFLTNFTVNERNVMKTLSQKSILDDFEYDSRDAADNCHYFDSSIETVLQNYDLAFSENITDTIFMLDVKQIYEVYCNSDILGEKYYIGEPTEECISNSDEKNIYISDEGKMDSWLRTPSAQGKDDTGVRIIESGGEVYIMRAYSSDVGVRPAFYLGDRVSFSEGTGTNTDPYKVGANSQTEETTDVYILNRPEDTLQISEDILSAEVELCNNTGVSKTVHLAFAIYGENNILNGVWCDTITVASTTAIIPVSAAMGDKPDKIRIFIWEQDISPICNAKEISLNNIIEN